MTNKPMLSVEREMIERWTTGRVSLSHLAEMRALLDAPIKSFAQSASESAYCQKGPAAQHQVEPIKLPDYVREFLQEWINSSTGGEDEDIDYDFANQLGVLLGPLYAAPPAQQQGAPSEVIAFGIQVEKMLCDALGREWSASGISINSLIAELKDKHQGAPVAWVIDTADGRGADYYPGKGLDTLEVGALLYAEQPAEHQGGVDGNSHAPKHQSEPVGWQFYQDGKWWNGDDRIKDHRKNTVDAGYKVRNTYAEQPEPVAVVMPEGLMIAERCIWTEEQAKAAGDTITLLKNVPGMTDRTLGLAAADAAQCKAPDISLAEVARLNAVKQ